MGNNYHFMDGGGKDNSGASTSEAIFNALINSIVLDTTRPVRNSEDSLFASLVKKIKFIFVSISNSPNAVVKVDTRKIIKNRFELISPVVGIVNSGINGNAYAADGALQARYDNDKKAHLGLHTDYIAVKPTHGCIQENNETWTPVLPLGWQISKPALKRLRAGFNTEENEDNGIAEILKLIPY